MHVHSDRGPPASDRNENAAPQAEGMSTAHHGAAAPTHDHVQNAHDYARIALDEIINVLRSAAAEVVGHSLESDSHFSNAGFDSLSAVEFTSALTRMLKVDVPGAQPAALDERQRCGCSNVASNSPAGH